MDYCFSVNFLTKVIILGYVREFLGFRKCTLKCLEEEREGRSRGRKKEGSVSRRNAVVTGLQSAPPTPDF